jgi:hypothetical protein
MRYIGTALNLLYNYLDICIPTTCLCNVINFGLIACNPSCFMDHLNEAHGPLFVNL